MMNKYKIELVFNIDAEDIHQAHSIVTHEIQKNVTFKGVPYSATDSGIVNFGVIQLNDEDTESVRYKMTVRS
jgi:hypothetical protein